MVSLNALFWLFVILFAIIGAMRGWAKELLVTFSAILAFFIVTVLETYVPFVKDTLKNNPDTLFWLRITVLTLAVFFGYQSPNIQKFAAGGRFAREKLQDYLLGFLLGAINAYLFVGTIWWYLHQANYPGEFIVPPDPNTPLGLAALDLLEQMPPVWLKPPGLFFAVALAFAFVLIVFL
ncbi:CvpA family protein [Anaerolinea thermophila]|uniref:CvpA family protein n=2 Tax=Anaerolinea TaxID=233189 RepID=UPI0026ED3E78|nr:CvpA family protein [Anaerolinea thermophila]